MRWCTAFGAAFDNPDLVVFCVVGDGEAETGPLAASWHSNKFLNPAVDGTVVPILALNGWKIANPTILERIGDDELIRLLEGYGYAPKGVVAGDEPMAVHELMADTMDAVMDEVAAIKVAARAGSVDQTAWPMIVLRTPKGWTGPKVVDGKRTEGTWRSHQVPLSDVRAKPEHLAQLEASLARIDPRSCSTTPVGHRTILALSPSGDRRMSANPHANGGLLLEELRLPDFRRYGVAVTNPGTSSTEATRVLGTWLRDVVRDNPTNFRVFGPDRDGVEPP